MAQVWVERAVAQTLDADLVDREDLRGRGRQLHTIRSLPSLGSGGAELGEHRLSPVEHDHCPRSAHGGAAA